MGNEKLPYQNMGLASLVGEEWRDIEDFEGYYQVSNMGRVKSLERTIFVNVGNGHYREISKKILKQDIRIDTKYSITSRVNLCYSDENKKQYHAMVSRLVACAFFKENININKIIVHTDGNTLNNSVTNIYWGNEDDLSNILYKARKNKNSKYHGVCKINGYYRVSCTIKKNRRTEYFKTELEAAKEYDRLVKLHKLNRELNFPYEK